MSLHGRRSNVRVTVSLDVTLEVIDPITLKAMGSSFPATTVDVSTGGIRFDALAPAGVHFKRDLILEAKFGRLPIGLHGRILMQVAHYMPYQSDKVPCITIG